MSFSQTLSTTAYEVARILDIVSALDKLKSAQTDIDRAAAVSELTAQLIASLLVNSSLRVAGGLYGILEIFSKLRLGYALSGQIWKWEKICQATGVGTSVGLVTIINFNVKDTPL